MIDVVIPVYRGFAQTKRCIESVLAHTDRTMRELVVVDDATPEPALAHYLDQLQLAGSITLIRNESNRGFVHSANRGMSLHVDRDVVLLNSDTEVANDWLGRLRHCAYRDADIGTVTPLSNNATICSYPYEGWTGGIPGSLGLTGLDDLIARVNARCIVDLPTAVGFCMYVRRACLDAVGTFDEDRFGRGYGEENDFSLRARAAGWRSVLAADVFVFHEGNVSFGGERHALQRNAMATLLEAHPDYQERLGEFSRRDPLRPVRHAVDQARYALGGAELEHVLSEQRHRLTGASGAVAGVVLHVTHSWDGGTRRWIDDFCAHDALHRNLVLRSVSNRDFASWRVELLDPSSGDAPLHHWDLGRPIAATATSSLEYRLILDEVLRVFGVGSLIVSSLVGHSLEALETGLPTVVVLHDLYPFCPAMFATFGSPCTACGRPEIERCMRGNLHNAFWHNTDAELWLSLRDQYARRLAQPWVRLAAPSHSAWNRWIQLMPGIEPISCAIIPHGLACSSEACASAEIRRNQVGSPNRLRLVVPGRLLPHKGLDLFANALPGLLRHADLLLLGCGRFGEPFEATPGVTVVRHYSRDELARHVRAFEPDAALLLSVVPESFSYTLSEMLALGLPVIATNAGAFAERLRDGHDGLLVAPGPAAVAEAAERLSADRDLLRSMKGNVCARPVRTVVEMVADYAGLLSGIPAPGPARVDNASRTDELLQWIARDRDDRHRVELALAQAQRSRDELVARCGELEARLADTRRTQDVLIRDIGKVHADLSALRQSNSWRMTAPVRMLTGALRRLKGRHEAAVADLDDVPRADPAQPDRHTGALPNSSAAAASGDAHRHALRERLQLPSATRVVVGWNVDDDAAFTAQLLALASTVAKRQNDTCFVIPRSDESGRDRDAPLLRATRRLFLLPGSEISRDVLLGADVIVTAGPHLPEAELQLSRKGVRPKILVLAAAPGHDLQGGAEMAGSDVRTVADEAAAALFRILEATSGRIP